MKQALVITILTLSIAVVITWAFLGPGYLRYREEKRLVAEGLPAIAKIVSLEETGNTFNYKPEIIIRLEVTTKGKPPWKAVYHRVMNVMDTQFFTAGRYIPVKYDPDKPDYVVYAP